MSSDCLILRANSAAHRLCGVAPGELPGKSIRRYVPALGRVPFLGETPQAFRTEMQCRGEREHGDVFLANVFFSTYQTAVGPRLAALVVDASEELQTCAAVATFDYACHRLVQESRNLAGGPFGIRPRSRSEGLWVDGRLCRVLATGSAGRRRSCQ